MTWWHEQFQIYRASDRNSAEIRGKHLYAVTRLTPIAMAANLLNGLIVCVALWDSVSHAALLTWILILASTATAAIVNWRRRRARVARPASPAAIRRATLHAAWLALIWAFVPVAWFVGADPPHRLLIAILACGMLSAGAFALETVPSASLAYVAILAASCAYALIDANEPVYLYAGALLAIYVIVIASGVLSAARLFTARLLSERHAERQGQMVALLLRDFEEHAADVLWETDLDGRFTHVSQRLATLLGSAPGDAPSEALLSLIEQSRVPGEADASRDLLRKALAADRPFRDIVLPVQTKQGSRWWSFTAKPVVGESGQTEGWRGVIADVTGERRAQQRLQQLAHCDPLTGLANRMVLRDRLTRFTKRGSGARSGAALLFIDLDNFKMINDTFGHSVGDVVLQIVAERLGKVVRDRDLLARLGGDEFAIVLSDAGAVDEVAAIAQRLLRGLAVPCVAQGRSVTLSASVGIALLPEHGSSADEALGNADLALYAAKVAGRGRFEFFAPMLSERPRRRQAIEQELQQALSRGQLALHWQPLVELSTGSPVGIEALLRWQHPELGSVAPAEFVAVAEECGLIEEIGAWALSQACREAAAIPGGLRVCVNISPSQLMQSNFVETVEAVLRSAGLPAPRLELDITESIFFEKAPAALTNLRRLKQIGVRIALDDFGTGVSSIGYLLHFPFDTLKIDGRFVRRLLSRGDALQIAGNIVALAGTLGMSTVAEGVEEPEQAELLRRAGCAAMQGYLVARPTPIAELRTLLEQGSQPRGFRAA